MTFGPIMRGDPSGLLQRGPAKLEDETRWDKRDSDILAHFLQVHKQLTRSRWYAAKKSFKTQGGELIEASMPDLEQFVFAAIYFRQFTTRKDNLLGDATKRYCSHVACPIRKSWVKSEADAFATALDSPPFPLAEKDDPTLRDLFDAFIYGASLVHTVPHENSPTGKLFLKLYDNEPIAKLLYELNVGMEVALNHIGHIAAIVHQDFVHWQHTYSLPLPDVRWHERLFNVPCDGRAAHHNEP